jgi:hypothetical protein
MRFVVNNQVVSRISLFSVTEKFRLRPKYTCPAARWDIWDGCGSLKKGQSVRSATQAKVLLRLLRPNSFLKSNPTMSIAFLGDANFVRLVSEPSVLGALECRLWSIR